MTTATHSSVLNLTKAEFQTLFNTAAAAGVTVIAAEIICLIAQKALADLTESISCKRSVILGVAIATVWASRWLKTRPLMDRHASDVGVLTGLMVSYKLSAAAFPLITSVLGGAAAGAVMAGSLVARKAKRY